MNSKIHGACGAHARLENLVISGSTPGIPVTPEHSKSAAPHEELLNPHRIEDDFLDSLIANQSPTIIFTINKYQEHVLLHGYDDKVIVARHATADLLKLIYKHAISTIQRDSKPARLKITSNNASSHFESNHLEMLWLDKAIRTRCEVTLTITSGYQERGIIVGYDEGVISFVREKGDLPNIMYKHAISTITMKESSEN